MSVIRKNKKWYYQFIHSGVPYRGTCIDCKNKEQAKKYEKKIREEKKTEFLQADKIKYHESRITQIQGGTEIKLKDAFDLMIEKPFTRTSSTKTQNQNRSFFNDFVSFMDEEYSITTLQQVKKVHAEAYISYIRENGRFNRITDYVRDGKKIAAKNTCKNLSSASLNKIHQICHRVFEVLKEDGGLSKNPFELIGMVKNIQGEREYFTVEERLKILSANDDFCVPIFWMGFYTGLREGDICHLKWENIDFEKEEITVKMRKTKETVMIPIISKNYDFLKSLQTKADSEYVFPIQHEMYENHRSGVSYRIKKFLESLGIESSSSVEGRDRKISTKDFHSCRHTFAIVCCENNISLHEIQNALGHTDSKITEIYTAHRQRETAHKAFRDYKLTPKQVTRHGIYNILKFAKLFPTADAQKDSNIKVAYMISEKLKREELTEIFKLYGIEYTASNQNGDFSFCEDKEEIGNLMMELHE